MAEVETAWSSRLTAAVIGRPIVIPQNNVIAKDESGGWAGGIAAVYVDRSGRIRHDGVVREGDGRTIVDIESNSVFSATEIS